MDNEKRLESADGRFLRVLSRLGSKLTGLVFCLAMTLLLSLSVLALDAHSADLNFLSGKVTAAATQGEWREKNGKKYYYDANNQKVTGMQKIDGYKYYFNKKGVMQTGLQTIDGKTYYFSKKNGKMLTGWQTLGKKQYYFNNKGVMVTGLKTIEEKTYFFNEKGAMQTGWQTVKDKKYYFGDNGVMTTGWKTINEQKYYFNAKGVMATGFEKINKKFYFFGTDGVMKTGWQTIGVNKYYFNSKGVMITGLKTIEKKIYYFNDKGVMQTGLQKVNKKWYYFDTKTGERKTGSITIGNKIYYFDPKTGEMDPSKTRNTSQLEIRCTNIVSQRVNSSDSVNTKLSKLFSYVTWSYGYYRTYNFSGASGWYKTYAMNMLNSGVGNCYSYAATFACLAKKATNLPVRVGWGSTPALGGGLTPHGWCEIQIGGTWYVFDPDLYRYVYPGSCYYQTMGQVGGYYYNRHYEMVTF